MKMLRGVIKTDDRDLIARITIVLKGFGAFPRAVHWNVSLPDGSTLEPPMIGFLLPEDQMGEVVRGFDNVGVTVYSLASDPVKDHAYLDEKDLDGEKFVVVKWMPPVENGLGIVDVEDTQFAVVLDLTEYPVERENELLVAELCSTLQHAANEMNRLHGQIQKMMSSKVATAGRTQ